MVLHATLPPLLNIPPKFQTIRFAAGRRAAAKPELNFEGIFKRGSLRVKNLEIQTKPPKKTKPENSYRISIRTIKC